MAKEQGRILESNKKNERTDDTKSEAKLDEFPKKRDRSTGPKNHNNFKTSKKV